MKKELLAIKRGEVSIEDTLKKSYEVAAEFEKAYEKTSLPDEPDYDAANEFLIMCREKAAYKHFTVNKNISNLLKSEV